MTGPKPQGPTHPTPTGPPRSALKPPARQSDHHHGHPLAGGPGSISGRDGKGAVERASRPGFTLPQQPRFSIAEGRHRLVGAVWPPEGPFPGSPPGPPPDPGPPPTLRQDPPDPKPIPNPHPYPPPFAA